MTLLARTFTRNVWLLDELSVTLKNELEAKERSVSPGDKHFEMSEFSRYRSTTSSFHTGSEFIKSNCVFCSGNNHNSDRCAKVTDPSARKQIIFQKNLCYICMSPKHKTSKCNPNYICKKCNGRHYVSICQKGSLKSTVGNNSGAENNSTNVQPALSATNQHQTQTVPNSYQQNQNDQTVINSADTVTNYSGNSYKNILLQTANAEVINLDNRNSEKCNILFDSGVQRTYIIKSLKDKLKLGWIISGPCSIDNETKVYNVDSHFLFVPPSLFNANAVEKESFESYSKIWDIESVGVTKKELEVYRNLSKFNGLEVYQNFENELEIK